MENNLPELRDIHLPEGISIWPPAYGWMVIALAIALLIVFYEIWRLWRRKSKKIHALRLLSQTHSQEIVSSARQMSEILRRICVYKYPGAAGIFGKTWIDFLNEHSKEKISGQVAMLLRDAPYISIQSEEFSHEDLEKLRNFCQSWIGENL